MDFKMLISIFLCRLRAFHDPLSASLEPKARGCGTIRARLAQ